jgi:pimeloyl-ACP methyl ester carboxylesterase
MGGGIAMQLAIRFPERYQGIILFAPAIREWYNKDKGKKILGKIF